MTVGSWPALTEIIRCERWKWDTEASATGILQPEGTKLAVPIGGNSQGGQLREKRHSQEPV